MRIIKSFLNVIFVVIASMTFSFAQSVKIEPLGVHVTTGFDNGNLSFDGNLLTSWFPGWNPKDYPSSLVVDLGDTYQITKISIYDNTGKPDLTFEVYDSVLHKFVKLIDVPLSLYQKWQDIELVSGRTNILRITLSDMQSDNAVPEIVLYGSKTPITVTPPKNLKKLSGDAAKFGVCGFHWVPFRNAEFKYMRMYQVLEWTWTKDGCAFSPTRDADGDYDKYLRLAKDNGVETIFCPNKVPYWLVVNHENEWADRRIHKAIYDGSRPEHYVDVCGYYWQLAARYGRVKYDTTLLKINKLPRWFGDVTNKPLSGLNLLNYIEIENEPDRPWKSVDYKYTPEQYAALLSAAHDAIKSADPSMKVVMGGLSSLNTEYLTRMMNWFKSNRADKRFPCDVITGHHYCNMKNKFPKPDIDIFQGEGISPEQDRLGERLDIFVKWCKLNAPHTKVWFTEFGYDTKVPTTVLSQYAKPYDTYSSEDVQAMWLQRTYLIALSKGLDVITMYNAIDENSAALGYVYGSSGLSSGQYPSDNSPSLKKKRSYFDLLKLSEDLNGYKFNGELKTNDPKVHVLYFINGRKQRFFYWAEGDMMNITIGKEPLIASNTPQSYTRTMSIFENNNLKAVVNDKLIDKKD